MGINENLQFGNIFVNPRSQLLPFRAVRPQWFARWRPLHLQGEQSMAAISYNDIAHRIRLLTTLEDIHTSALRARSRIVKRLLSDHAAHVTRLGGEGESWSLPPAHLKLALRPDAGGYRL
jgi:hypothetical protein